ncbi:hypothetical protein, partial [Streptomyces caniscabiei]|uniref:hypothetical protein n=1 Tax=Streptomyces caniscabiei TaxID=2746961 RepID=UPI0038F682D4
PDNGRINDIVELLEKQSQKNASRKIYYKRERLSFCQILCHIASPIKKPFAEFQFRKWLFHAFCNEVKNALYATSLASCNATGQTRV